MREGVTRAALPYRAPLIEESQVLTRDPLVIKVTFIYIYYWCRGRYPEDTWPSGHV